MEFIKHHRLRMSTIVRNRLHLSISQKMNKRDGNAGTGVAFVRLHALNGCQFALMSLHRMWGGRRCISGKLAAQGFQQISNQVR